MLNILQITSFNKDKFNELYSIYKVFNIVDYAKPEEIETNIIYSVAYEQANSFYCLAVSNATQNDITNLFKSYKYKYERVNVDEVPQNILLNLLINKTANKELKYNNFSSELYVSYNKENKNIIPTLSFSVNESSVLSCKVVTFSRYNEKTKHFFTTKQKKNIDEGKTSSYKTHGLYLVNGYDKNNIFYKANINRNFKKNTVTYLDLTSEKHKVEYIDKIISKLNRENKNIIHISFNECEYKRVFEAKKAQSFDEIINPSELKHINIINTTIHNVDDSIIKTITKDYSISNAIKHDCYNLAIIKPIDEYIDEIDEYKHSNEDIIQNIEYNNFSLPAIKQCLLEMRIKEEALNSKTKLFDFKGEWAFYQLINGIPHQMIIKDNMIDINSFGCIDSTHSLFNELSDNKTLNPKIVIHNGNSLEILDTELRLMPDYKKFKEDRSNLIKIDSEGKKHKIIQRKDIRDEYYGEIIDINNFEYENNTYYTVGNIGYGVRRQFTNSVSTKRYINNGLDISEVVEQLKPNIYQINKYCVYPYPFKLMNECFVMLGGKLDD